MRSAVGSDEQTHLTDFVGEGLEGRDDELELRGPLAGEAMLWPEAAERVAMQWSKGAAWEGCSSAGGEG